jgi:SPP1 family predicted phage head-tail adaptor
LDAYGEATGSWATDNTVWAAIEPVNGSERDIGEGKTGIVSHRVVMRYTSDVSPKKRLLFGSRVLNIDSVLNVDERDERMSLFCVEEVSE